MLLIYIINNNVRGTCVDFWRKRRERFRQEEQLCADFLHKFTNLYSLSFAY
jgi:hypothetical protein